MFDEANGSMDDMVEVADETESELTKYEKVRLAFLYATYILAALVGLGGIISALFSIPILSFVTAHFGFLTLACAWLAFGTHLGRLNWLFIELDMRLMIASLNSIHSRDRRYLRGNGRNVSGGL
jgi:hypothetical protein